MRTSQPNGKVIQPRRNHGDKCHDMRIPLVCWRLQKSSWLRQHKPGEEEKTRLWTQQCQAMLGWAGRGKKVELYAMCVYGGQNEAWRRVTGSTLLLAAVALEFVLGGRKNKKTRLKVTAIYSQAHLYHIKPCRCLLEMFLCVCHAYLHNFTQKSLTESH